MVFDAVLDALRRLRGAATPATELRGWAYHRDRDLTGFEDGTENPTLASAPAYALVPDGAPGAGGSVLLLQQWSHDPAWLELADADQERAMGRTKAGSDELEPDPGRSRRTWPAPTRTTRATCCAATPPTARSPTTARCSSGSRPAGTPLHTMLERMAGLDGPRDELTRFATPADRRVLLGAGHRRPGRLRHPADD